VDRNVVPPGRAAHRRGARRAFAHVAGDGRDTEQFAAGPAEQVEQCQRIIDVGADVGVEQDGNSLHARAVVHGWPHERKASAKVARTIREA
jgi:hypothetical protein